MGIGLEIGEKGTSWLLRGHKGLIFASSGHCAQVYIMIPQLEGSPLEVSGTY